MQARVPGFNLDGIPDDGWDWALPTLVVLGVTGVFAFAVIRIRRKGRQSPEREMDEAQMSELEDSTFADVLDDELAALD